MTTTNAKKIKDRVRRYILGRLDLPQMRLFERELEEDAQYPNPLFGKAGFEDEPQTLPLSDWLEATERQLVEEMFARTLDPDDAAAFSAYVEQGDWDRKDRIREQYILIEGGRIV